MNCLTLFSSSAPSIISLDLDPRQRSSSSLASRATNSFSTARCEMKVEANFYEVLSLDSGAAVNIGAEEIKKAYRSMARRYHPDACADTPRKEECTRRFIELQRAYETLSDPRSRRRYDAEMLKHGEEGRRQPPEFPRVVWETQLRELGRRSELRGGKRVN